MKNFSSRRVSQILWDLGSWLFAVPLALFLRFDFDPPQNLLLLSVLSGLLLGTLHILIGFTFYLYQGRYVVGSFDEVLGIVSLTVLVGLIGTMTNFLIESFNFPRSIFLISTGLAGAIMLSIRFISRGISRKKALGRKGVRTLIYGAGDAGFQIVNLMLNDSQNLYQPIGFIDDAPAKNHLRQSGIRVLGDSSQLENICKKESVQNLLVAIAGISAKELLVIDQRLRPLGVDITVIPTASEIAGGAIKLGDISEATEEDLMGRQVISTDETQIYNFFSNKRILVTGAGGSIGSEIVRQLFRYQPSEVFLLDRDESALHAAQMTIDGSGHLLSPNLILADIRDFERINEILIDTKPEVVFHAAALKHLPLLERFPEEAFKTNVKGTANVLQAAINSDVKYFVNISTDKAADPTSILGKSKLITEQLTAGVPIEPERKYVSVRFGNVLGSRGSVSETFRFQIEKGGPVTVTDKSVTRFFMTISEAVHLVLQAAVIGSHGDTLILDMGSPVNIAELAELMIKRSGRNIKIKFTGLRPGEKLNETLFARNEDIKPTTHSKIHKTSMTPRSLSDQIQLNEIISNT